MRAFVCVWVCMCVHNCVSATAAERHRTQTFQNGKTFFFSEDNKDNTNNTTMTPGQTRPDHAIPAPTPLSASLSNEPSWKIFIVYQTICIN